MQGLHHAGHCSEINCLGSSGGFMGNTRPVLRSEAVPQQGEGCAQRRGTSADLQAVMSRRMGWSCEPKNSTLLRTKVYCSPSCPGVP